MEKQDQVIKDKIKQMQKLQNGKQTDYILSFINSEIDPPCEWPAVQNTSTAIIYYKRNNGLDYEVGHGHFSFMSQTMMFISFVWY